MSRAVLAVMAGLLCAFAGMKYANRLQHDANRLQRWVQLFRHLALLLEEGTLAIPQVLLAAADSASSADDLLRCIATAVQSHPRLTLESAFHQCSHDAPEKPTLARFFSRLGHGSKESRCLAAQQAAQELELLAKSAKDKADKDVKLWQTLGFIGGTCLTILLL